jgi:hypothetical protein
MFRRTLDAAIADGWARTVSLERFETGIAPASP